MTPPRVRFAPSPTGYLHVGGARTALFNWLFARHTGGTMVLRIEDTDRERSTEAHTRVILDGLTWLGITWDEGPFFQGEYGPRHRADAERLLAEGKAYRCFCTREELDAQRARRRQPGSAFRYDRRCYRLCTPPKSSGGSRAGAPFTIRFLLHGRRDRVGRRGARAHQLSGRDLDDFVILRSDGTRHLQPRRRERRHRHADHPRDPRRRPHLQHAEADRAVPRARAEPPVFAHVPMILGTDGKKLSKRHGATAVGDYQDLGILPAAMRNFLALLGWSPGGDREILPEERDDRSSSRSRASRRRPPSSTPRSSSG